MRSFAVMALCGASAGALALVVSGTLMTGFTVAPVNSASAMKGDRHERAVKVACDATTMLDTGAGCAELAGMGAPGGGFITAASTSGNTTILTRLPSSR
ncbi:hypothetical protein [Stappia sp.]|uniref:hypothetical protein n=1 Tax=Stappia sp. TaxID=1870903 RepID=UPI003A9933E6